MKKYVLTLTAFVAVAAFAFAADKPQKQAPAKALGPSIVDFNAFIGVTKEVGEYRAKRLVDVETFNKMAKEPGTIILDTRSQSAYEKKHLKGAVHLNFSDFTEGKLARVIPSKDTRILIYCNNNISGDAVNFASKSPPLALNVPTFVNLYGYDYKNVYELSNLIQATDPRLQFEGTDVEKKFLR
jgi:rhodanese-related sulfurtransferase